MQQQAPVATIIEHFSTIEEPRRYNRRHLLLDIIVIAVCAAICGADDWVAVEDFGKAKLQWFKRQTEKGAHHLGSFPVPHFVLQYSPPIQVGGHDPPLDKMRFSWHDLVSGKINEKQTDMHLDDARFVRWRRSAWLRRRIQS